MWYVLDLNPEPWAVGPVGSGRKNGRMYSYVGRNQQLAAYKEAVQEELAEQVEIINMFDRVKLQFFFWRNRAEYTTPQARTHRKHEADLTNLQKATEDALQGVFFANDRDVVECHSYLVEQGPDIVGRIIISVEQADPVLNPDLIPPYVWGYTDDTQTELPFSVLKDEIQRDRGDVPF